MASWDKEWAMTFTGKRVFPFDLKPEDVDVKDLARGISQQCRYNGHTDRFYSVGEHCLLISYALFRDGYGPMVAMQGLLHDAGEAYTGDFTRPVKNSLREVGEMLKAAEDRNEKVIFDALGVDHPLHPQVKEYDRRIIVDERNTLFGPHKPWDWDLKPLDVRVRGWVPGVPSCQMHPPAVEALWLSTFNLLRNDPAYGLTL